MALCHSSRVTSANDTPPTKPLHKTTSGSRFRSRSRLSASASVLPPALRRTRVAHRPFHLKTVSPVKRYDLPVRRAVEEADAAVGMAGSVDDCRCLRASESPSSKMRSTGASWPTNGALPGAAAKLRAEATSDALEVSAPIRRGVTGPGIGSHPTRRLSRDRARRRCCRGGRCLRAVRGSTREYAVSPTGGGCSATGHARVASSVPLRHSGGPSPPGRPGYVGARSSGSLFESSSARGPWRSARFSCPPCPGSREDPAPQPGESSLYSLGAGTSGGVQSFSSFWRVRR